MTDTDTSHLVGKSRFTDESKRLKAQGQRGKSAEKEVQDQLEKWNKLRGFAYHRLPDARAAQGRLAAQPADFLAWYRVADSNEGFTCSIALEVKEIQGSEYRLPKDKLPQLARMKKLAMAGVHCFVLVKFKGGKWRVAFAEDLDSDVPSWDFREAPMYDKTFDTCAEAMVWTGVFPGVK